MVHFLATSAKSFGALCGAAWRTLSQDEGKVTCPECQRILATPTVDAETECAG